MHRTADLSKFQAGSLAITAFNLDYESFAGYTQTIEEVGLFFAQFPLPTGLDCITYKVT